jgi:hypothetical protein
MLENDFVAVFRDVFREYTAGIAVVPFSFGTIPLEFGFDGNINGDLLYHKIQSYLNEAPIETGWPCWEMNDHDTVKG